MKEIVDAEDAFSEDEKEEAKALVPVTNTANEESEDEDVDVEGMEDHAVQAVGDEVEVGFQGGVDADLQGKRFTIIFVLRNC
jgi:hypothetical protein